MLYAKEIVIFFSQNLVINVLKRYASEYASHGKLNKKIYIL